MLAVRQGKGKKDRFVPISERAMGWLKKYTEDVRPGFALEPDPRQVFLEKNGELMTPDRLSRRVPKYIKEAEVGKTGSCHLFRHTVATLMMDNGADIRLIQQMLGHASILTTEIYTHVSIVKLKEIHALTHPSLVRARTWTQERDADAAALWEALAEEAEEDNAA